MPTNNSSNNDYLSNADGAQITGGTVARILKWSGSNITLAGSGTNTYTFPSVADTLLGSKAPTLTSQAVGSPIAGQFDYDGTQLYQVVDSIAGRGGIPVQQYFHLTTAGAAITTIANFFGATSNISLVASAFYEIDVYLFFLKTTAGTVTWTFTNSAAPTGQNFMVDMSPIAGVQASLTTPAALANVQISSQVYNDATAARAFTTGSLTTGVNHFARFKIFLRNGTGTSLKIQATNSAGSITPGINSYWICRRIAAGNVGTFAA